MMRLRLPVLLGLRVLCLLATSCGDDESESTAGAGTSAPAGFPVTIEHRYGATEITERPQRIVSVGLNEQDAFFALGIAPIGVTDWMGRTRARAC